MLVDIKTLEQIACRLREDAKKVHGLNPSAMLSIATIIDDAIGAPLLWPSPEAGVKFADDYYRGSPSSRLEFNHGVKWTIENYATTVEIKYR